MPGTNCSSCIFSTWEGNSQTGCQFNKLMYYKHIDALNEDYNGTYKVLTDNICPNKRTKSWLQTLETGEIAKDKVRTELYPKVQLFALVYPFVEIDSWVSLLSEDNKYSAVDLIYFGNTSGMLKDFGKLFHKKQMFFHATNEPDEGKNINHFFRQDCHFYVTTQVPNEVVKDYPDRIDYWLNEECRQIALVSSDILNGAVVYSDLHAGLVGFGMQDIATKIKIYCENHDQKNLIMSYEEFWGLE